MALAGHADVLLFAAFGVGELASSNGNQALRAAGWLILACCALNLYWPPMHSREVLAAGGGTNSDTLHLVGVGLTSALVLLIMVIGAASMPGRFRRCTVTAMILLAAFGVLTGAGARDVSHNLPTPWIGVWERINVGIFMSWVAAFSLVLRRPR